MDNEVSVAFMFFVQVYLKWKPMICYLQKRSSDQSLKKNPQSCSSGDEEGRQRRLTDVFWTSCSLTYINIRLRRHKLQMRQFLVFVFFFPRLHLYLISPEPFLVSCAPEPFRFRRRRRQRCWRQAAAPSRRCLGPWTKPAVCGRLVQPQGNCCMWPGRGAKQESASASTVMDFFVEWIHQAPITFLS